MQSQVGFQGSFAFLLVRLFSANGFCVVHDSSAGFLFFLFRSLKLLEIRVQL
jgi:hypothetical protein